MAEMKVALPDLGDEAGDTARVSFWYVEPGEKVSAGDNLLQMLTDKATFDVPAPGAGTIKQLLVGENDVVKVGGPLCILVTAE